MIFLAGLTILKKKRCLGILSACGVDPVVALRLRHQTRAFLIAVNNKNLSNGLLDNSEKEDVSGQMEHLRG